MAAVGFEYAPRAYSIGNSRLEGGMLCGGRSIWTLPVPLRDNSNSRGVS